MYTITVSVAYIDTVSGVLRHMHQHLHYEHTCLHIVIYMSCTDHDLNAVTSIT